jgi:hypothetical protein
LKSLWFGTPSLLAWPIPGPVVAAAPVQQKAYPKKEGQQTAVDPAFLYCDLKAQGLQQGDFPKTPRAILLLFLLSS